MKFSVVMLVSRSDKGFRRAVESVARQEPDEFRAYIDTVAIDYMDDPEVKRVLKEANAVISTQHPSLSWDRHENMVHNLHRAFLEVEGEWFSQCADDDEMFGASRNELIRKYARNDVGILHGDKFVSYPTWQYFKSFQFKEALKSFLKPSLVWGKPVTDHHQIKGYIHDGTVTVRKKAFEQVHSILDHGYFCDWKYFYWILRVGWKAKYIPEVLYWHRHNPYVKAERKKHWGTWEKIMKELDEVDYEVKT